MPMLCVGEINTMHAINQYFETQFDPVKPNSAMLLSWVI